MIRFLLFGRGLCTLSYLGEDVTQGADGGASRASSSLPVALPNKSATRDLNGAFELRRKLWVLSQKPV